MPYGGGGEEEEEEGGEEEEEVGAGLRSRGRGLRAGTPTSLTFTRTTEFLLSMEDSVDETESVKRYNQYKLDFRRQQLQDFFLQHKDHEWFRSKYHPDDITAKRAESLNALKTRLSVFLFLLDNSWLDSLTLDMEQAPAIIKLLDAAGGTAAGGTAEGEKSPAEPMGGEKSPAEPMEGEKSPAEPMGGGARTSEVKASREEMSRPEKKEKKKEEKKKEEKKKKKKNKDRKRKRSVSVDSGGSESESSNSEGEEKEDEEEKEEEEEDGETARRKDRGGDRKEREKEAPAKPRPLHLTTSLFIRSIPPEFSKEDITNVPRLPAGGAVRPQPERRFFRRCWVTFDRSVNIKETCWNLQNIRLRDSELSPVVNRDLCRRVRCVNGLTHHRPVVRNDIRLSARLIHSLDLKGALWRRTRFLKNITDFLIEEVSAEEEELIGASGGNEEDKDPASSSEVAVETDNKLITVLDRLLLYLRLVHSVDYYNFCDEHQKMCEEQSLSEEEAAKLGKKDPEQEVEKFLVANSQELSKDKWLCPLSGKKFKAPEFVRKHILNKHGDKVSPSDRKSSSSTTSCWTPRDPPSLRTSPSPATRYDIISWSSPQQQSLLGYPPGVRPPMPGFPGGGPPYNPNQFGAGAEEEGGEEEGGDSLRNHEQ
ncbi:hypothetical protein F7725_016235, partial [Dissostichus mawsoni]